MAPGRGAPCRYPSLFGECCEDRYDTGHSCPLLAWGSWPHWCAPETPHDFWMQVTRPPTLPPYPNGWHIDTHGETAPLSPKQCHWCDTSKAARDELVSRLPGVVLNGQKEGEGASEWACACAAGPARGGSLPHSLPALNSKHFFVWASDHLLFTGVGN